MNKFLVALLVCAALCAYSQADKSIHAPYVHQKWDTPDWFNGGWACGPTSTVMAIAAFKHLQPHPINCSYPTRHENNYGWYVPSKYTAYGYTFDRMQHDASGKPAWGLYGHCTDGGAAWASRIQDALTKHQLKNKFYGTATFAEIKAAIDQGHLVILSTQLTSAGHLILVRGYTDSPQQVIVNDPWGDADKPGYGHYKNGEGIHYAWTRVAAKWMVEAWK